MDKATQQNAALVEQTAAAAASLEEQAGARRRGRGVPDERTARVLQPTGEGPELFATLSPACA
ncbi:hypothetical protein VSR82_17860 [Burkholderia sp. JPY481]|uniref:hypothetical protein n=1 Tax=Paraburkholderia sp. JPY465 TaxID=3042285 RepID=UPI003179E7BD